MIRVEETLLSEVERYLLGKLNEIGLGDLIQLPEGGMANTADDLVKRGFAQQIGGYYRITDAGRSQLRSNR